MKCCLNSIQYHTMDSQKIEELKNLCAQLIGGMKTEVIEYVVCVYAKDESKIMISITPVAPKMGPEDLMKGIASCVDTPLEGIKVHLFELCGGIDGKALSDSLH